jgi:hypothetical protein
MHSSRSSSSTRIQLRSHGKVVPAPDYDDSPAKRKKNKCITKPKQPSIQTAISKKTTSSLTTRTTRTQKSCSSTSNKQEDVGGVGTASTGSSMENKIRPKSSDSDSSSKTTKMKGVKLFLKETIVEEPSPKRCHKRLIGPAQKFDVVSHTPEVIRDVRQAPVCLPLLELYW